MQNTLQFVIRRHGNFLYTPRPSVFAVLYGLYNHCWADNTLRESENLEMNKQNKLPPNPPSGIKPDYERLYGVGTHGPLDEDIIVEVLHTELTPRFQECHVAIEQSWPYLRQTQEAKDFLKAYSAFREITQIYPMTAKNWHSGERIPLVHAEEVANDAIALAFQAHYKHAYQSLREIFELTVLQVHFYKVQDKSIVGQWGRGEMRTPTLKEMLNQLGQDSLYKIANDKMGISKKIFTVYDDLGAYVHTRGVPTISMGLTGSNIITFTPEALERFLTLFAKVSHLCVIFLAIFFPTAIIYISGFEKFGHLVPIWLPRKDHVNAIRAVLPTTELQLLENLASQNTWFQQILAKVNTLPDLNKAEIHDTYTQLESASKQGPARLIQLLKETNKVLE